MSKFLLLSMILLFITCSKRGTISHFTVDDFSALLFKRWMTSYELVELNQLFINTTVDSPPSGEVPLLGVKYIVNTEFEYRFECLIYKIPYYKDGKIVSSGELNLVEMDKQSNSCGDKSIKSIAKISDIMQLGFFANFNHKNVSELVPPFSMKLMFKLREDDGKTKIKDVVFPFFNMDMSRVFSAIGAKVMPSRRERGKFASSTVKRFMDSVILFPRDSIVEKQGLNYDTREMNFSSTYEDDPVKCHDVNEKCETTVKYSCDRCKWGFYETVGSGCLAGGAKFCGVNRCGGKGRPACYRGKTLGKYYRQGQCDKDNLFGFCREGLLSICDKNSVLVCI